MHLVCAHCGATNRVPEERLQDQPVCGRCGSELAPSRPLALSDSLFADYIARTEAPVLVDFWAAWCGPCRMMAPQFEAAARALKGQALLVKVNSDEAQGLSARYGIRSIPTLIHFEGGRERQRISGALQAPQILQWLRQAR